MYERRVRQILMTSALMEQPPEYEVCDVRDALQRLNHGYFLDITMAGNRFFSGHL